MIVMLSFCVCNGLVSLIFWFLNVMVFLFLV